MQEHDGNSPHKILPVFDPDLPEEVREALSAEPDKLLSTHEQPEHESPARTEEKEREPLSIRGRISLGIILLILTALLSGAVLWLTTVLMPLIWVLAAFLALGGVVMAFRAGGCWGGLFSIVLVVAALFVAEALGSTGVSWLITGSVALLGVLLTLAVVFGDNTRKTEPTKVDTEKAPHLYHDRYVLPSDLGNEELRLLLRVQQAYRRIEPASQELGDAFDGLHADMVLREQEWRLAQILLKQTRLRADLHERSQEAVSDVVRASLKPQQDAIDASRKALNSRVEAIESYVSKIERAVTAQREWNQVEANVARNDEYGELLTEATIDLPGTDHLENGAELQAIRESRDAAIREALEAGEWLSNVADPIRS